MMVKKIKHAMWSKGKACHDGQKYEACEKCGRTPPYYTTHVYSLINETLRVLKFLIYERNMYVVRSLSACNKSTNTQCKWNIHLP